MALKLIGMIDNKSVEKALPEQAEVYIGRDWNDEMVKKGFLLGYAHVSRRHCVINNNGNDQYSVRDLDSSHGTYVNGLRIIHETLLKDGDTLCIAREFKFDVRIG